MKNKKTEGLAFRFLYPHAESNRNRQNRNLKFYPLNYRGGYFAKLIIFCTISPQIRILFGNVAKTEGGMKVNL